MAVAFIKVFIYIEIKWWSAILFEEDVFLFLVFSLIQRHLCHVRDMLLAWIDNVVTVQTEDLWGKTVNIGNTSVASLASCVDPQECGDGQGFFLACPFEYIWAC